MKLRLSISLLYTLLIMSVSVVGAQGACPQIVSQALQSMGENCEDIGRNSVCYGYDLVSAQFSEEVTDEFFSQPADIAELGILETIQTAEMNTDLSQWGVAVMSVQANIPNSIPGQAVRFVLLGDVEVESAVEPEGTFESIEPIDITLTDSANVRSGAGINFNIIGGVAAGETLAFDAQNADSTWYRTVLDGRIGWVFSDLLGTPDDLIDLPVIDGQQRGAMQAFYLRTGFGTPACEEAPQDTLVVQGPDGISIDLTVNGANINLGSTIAMRILPPGNIIEFTVIDGRLTIEAGNPDGSDLVLFENFRTTACLDEPENLGVDGSTNDRLINCEFTEPEFVPELDLGESFCVLENVENFNYNVDLACPQNDPEVPVIIEEVVTDEDSSDEPDATPTQDFNLCAEGNAWGDGRCQTDYDWQAGYYYGQVEVGIIEVEEIPGPFFATATPRPTATPEPEDDDDDKPSGPDLCANFEGDVWLITDLNIGDVIDTVFDDPGLPECP